MTTTTTQPTQQGWAVRQERIARTPKEDCLTASQWAAILDAHSHRCTYCGASDQSEGRRGLPPRLQRTAAERDEADRLRRGRLEKDHYMPVSLGGAHTAANIVPACYSCNHAKYDMPGEYFRRYLAWPESFALECGHHVPKRKKLDVWTACQECGYDCPGPSEHRYWANYNMRDYADWVPEPGNIRHITPTGDPDGIGCHVAIWRRFPGRYLIVGLYLSPSGNDGYLWQGCCDDSEPGLAWWPYRWHQPVEMFSSRAELERALPMFRKLKVSGLGCKSLDEEVERHCKWLDVWGRTATTSRQTPVTKTEGECR